MHSALIALAVGLPSALVAAGFLSRFALAKKSRSALLAPSHPPVVWESEAYLSMPEVSKEVFFGEVPAFDEILRVVGEFERKVNAAAQPMA